MSVYTCKCPDCGEKIEVGFGDRYFGGHNYGSIQSSESFYCINCGCTIEGDGDRLTGNLRVMQLSDFFSVSQSPSPPVPQSPSPPSPSPPMPIETCFPLAIYYEDLADASQHQQALIDAVLQLERDGAERRNYPEMAWTGDLHGVEQIHTNPNFEWIVGQVERHTAIYLLELGVDLTKVDLYIQRAWPIVSRTEQEIGSHCHNTAHISAVYYIKVPAEGTYDPGRLVFFNDARVNEVSPGLGSENTDIVDEDNYLNQLQAAYVPVAGRLLMFPAKQRHAVTMNETEELRLSLSFDIVLTATATAAGAYEFLTPPPSQWQKFKSVTAIPNS